MKHGRYGVNPDSVYMEFRQPQQHTGNQEILHLRIAIIEYLGPPVRAGAQAGIRIFEDALSVEFRQPVGINGKTGRPAVQDHAHAHTVQSVPQVH